MNRYDWMSAKRTLQTLASGELASLALKAIAAVETAHSVYIELALDDDPNSNKESLVEQQFRTVWTKGFMALTTLRQQATNDQNETLASALYRAELAVIALKPLNAESLHLEEIPVDKRVVIASGHQFHIDEISQWLDQGKTTNPFTQDVIEARDLAEIQAVGQLFVLPESIRLHRSNHAATSSLATAITYVSETGATYYEAFNLPRRSSALAAHVAAIDSMAYYSLEPFLYGSANYRSNFNLDELLSISSSFLSQSRRFNALNVLLFEHIPVEMHELFTAMTTPVFQEHNPSRLLLEDAPRPLVEVDNTKLAAIMVLCAIALANHQLQITHMADNPPTASVTIACASYLNSDNHDTHANAAIRALVNLATPINPPPASSVSRTLQAVTTAQNASTTADLGTVRHINRSSLNDID